MEIIKKVLMVLGAVFICLTLLGGSLIAFMAMHGKKSDQSSKEYVDENVPLIVSAWSQEEMLKRASPELIKIIKDKPGEFSKLFTDSAKLLGPLHRYKGCQGEAKESFSIAGGTSARAEYMADATFEHGDARIKVVLVLNSGQWQISGFHTISPQFVTPQIIRPTVSPTPTP